jgi:hypothetical protein
MSGKEAIIFIVDANHTMNVPYPACNSNPDLKSEGTRLSAVKDAIINKITSMAWRSSTHEFGIVVLKTRHTHHHLYSTNTTNISKFFTSGESIKIEEDDVPFPNHIELDFTRPSHHMLNIANSICATLPSTQTPEADFCQSLILAADTLHRRTSGKKYKRSIVLFTDAEHEVEIDGERLECVLNGLKKMDVRLEVVGLGFNDEGVFMKQEDEIDDENEDIVENEQDVVDLCADEDDEQQDTKVQQEATNETMITDNSQDFRMLIKRENEKLLLSLVQQIGGCVIAANGQDITSLLENYHSKHAPSSSDRAVRSKCEFKITPNLTIEARYSKVIDQKSLPSLKTDAYLLDETTGQPMKDGGGEFMTTPVTSILFHTLELDPDNPGEGNIEVPQESRTDAYRFGSDLIPLGKMDMVGINAAFKSPKAVEMIGYIPSKDVRESGLTLGPAYALFGGRESKRSMATVAALAKAMDSNGLWGFCRFVKSANGDPRLAILVPQQGEGKVLSNSEATDSGGWYLNLLQLPFADDVNYLKPPEIPMQDWGNNKENNVCDDLIDSLMIEDDELESKAIPFIALQSYQRMITHFSMNPITDEEEKKEGLSEERILHACRATPLCELDKVKTLSKKATEHVNSFLETFPLTKTCSEGKKSERKYWGDGN